MLLASYLKNLPQNPFFNPLNDAAVEFLEFTQVCPGLYHRRLPEDDSVISHDEYAGICFMASIIPKVRQKLDEVVEYGYEYHWQYNNKHPRVDGVKYLMSNPISSIKYLYNKIRGLNQIAIIELDNLQWIRQPRDIALYKLFSCTCKPNVLELLYFYISLLVTVAGKDFAANGGTRLLAWYKIVALETIGHKNLLFNLTAKYFRYKMKLLLGDNYVEDLHKMYFQDRLHPIHVMVMGLK
jgi:hypothetical protein